MYLIRSDAITIGMRSNKGKRGVGEVGWRAVRCGVVKLRGRGFASQSLKCGLWITLYNNQTEFSSRRTCGKGKVNKTRKE